MSAFPYAFQDDTLPRFGLIVLQVDALGLSCCRSMKPSNRISAACLHQTSSSCISAAFPRAQS